MSYYKCIFLTFEYRGINSNCYAIKRTIIVPVNLLAQLSK